MSGAPGLDEQNEPMPQSSQHVEDIEMNEQNNIQDPLSIFWVFLLYS